MSQNFSSGGSTPGQGTGGAGTGATDAGTTRDTSSTTTTGGASSTGLTPAGGQTTGAGTGAATGLAAQAQEYGKKVADAASTAKDFVSDKMSVVGDKLGELRNKEFAEVANDAKEYARQNPGQALLISAAAGFVLGLLLRGSRR